MDGICDSVFIRKLCINDAKVSVFWRNDPNVWVYTGNRPYKKITLKDEENWIKAISKENNSFRYAILIREFGKYKYIGNIQITNVSSNAGEFHIFIGSRSHWGRGIGSCATKLLCFHAFNNLGINSLYLYVNSQNSSALNIYWKTGFFLTKNLDGECLMQLTKKNFNELIDSTKFHFYSSKLL